MKLLATAIILLSMLAMAFARSEQAKDASGNSAQTVEVTRNGSQPSTKGPAETMRVAVIVGQEELRLTEDHSLVHPCRLTISLIQIGAKGEVQPLETG